MLKIFSFQKTLKNNNYAKNTILQYTSCMQRLRDEGITENSTSEEIKDALFRISTKPRTMKTYLAAIVEYEKSVMQLQDGLLKGNIRRELMNYAKDDTSGVEPKKTEQEYRVTISKSKNPKIKVGLLLQLESGLRISELDALKKEDITMHHNKIWLNVKKSKNNQPRFVTARDNKRLYEMLEEYLKSAEDRPFAGILTSGKEFLQSKDGATHDLRRHNSRARYIELRKSGKKKYEALNIVAEQLGHNNLVNTKRYLGVVWEEDTGGKYK